MSDQYESLLLDTDADGVRTIRLNRPEKMNAVNLKLADELPVAVEEASHDDAVRVVVITGAGRGFCAGLELSLENIQASRERKNSSRNAALDDLNWVGRWVLALTGCDKRSEEHTSELQSLRHLVCRLLLEKKKNTDS